MDLAAEMAGFVTVGQCEWADYPTKILEKHWPDVPRWRDIRTLTKESFYERTGLRTVDVISGGFPCQPFSVAGKHGGKDDDRYLWPEMLRVISELRPSWVLGENVPGIINLALDEVLTDLEREGYQSQTFIIPACGVDAPHKRNRVAILAYSATERPCLWEKNSQENGTQEPYHAGNIPEHNSRQRRESKPCSSGMVNGLRTTVYKTDPDSKSLGLQDSCFEQDMDAFTDCSSRERERADTGINSANCWNAVPLGELG